MAAEAGSGSQTPSTTPLGIFTEQQSQLLHQELDRREQTMRAQYEAQIGAMRVEMDTLRATSQQVPQGATPMAPQYNRMGLDSTIGKPQAFDPDRNPNSWHEFEHKLTAYLGVRSPNLVTVLDNVSKSPDTELVMGTMNQQEREGT